MPSNKELVNPIDDLLDHIALAIERWKAENTPETIEKKVRQLLDKNSDEVVMKLLGFDNHWGNWEIDKANGKNTATQAGQYMAALHQEAIKNWFSQVKLPALPSKVIKSIEQDARRAYEYELKNKASELARVAATTHATQLVTEFTSSRQVENRLKLMALLEPKEAQEPNNQPKTN